MYSQYLDMKLNEQLERDKLKAEDLAFHHGVKQPSKFKRSDSVGSMQEREPATKAEIAIEKHKSKS